MRRTYSAAKNRRICDEARRAKALRAFERQLEEKHRPAALDIPPFAPISQEVRRG